MDDLTLSAGTRAVAERLEHVHLGVRDLDRSVDFYRRVFGFAVRWRGTSRTGERSAHIGSDRFYLALTEGPDLAPAAPAGSAAVYHFGFVTPSLDAFRDRLRAEGVPWSEATPRAEGPAAYVLDPDGHEFEVVQYRPDYVYA